MRKALYAALAAAAILVLTAPAKPAAAMPITSPAVIGAATTPAGSVTQVHYSRWHRRQWAWRHHHDWAWHGPDWYPRHYWYAYPQPYWHAYNRGPNWGWGWHRSWWM